MDRCSNTTVPLKLQTRSPCSNTEIIMVKQYIENKMANCTFKRKKTNTESFLNHFLSCCTHQDGTNIRHNSPWCCALVSRLHHYMVLAHRKGHLWGGTHYIFVVAFLYYTQYIPVQHWQLQRGTANTSQGITTWSLRSDHKNTGEDTGLHLIEAKKRNSAPWAAISLLNLPRTEIDHKNFSPLMNMVQRSLSYLHLQPEPKRHITKGLENMF